MSESFNKSKIKNILISRTDAIGDVILTLPLVGLLREEYPNAKIYFLGQNYTKDIVAACTHVDEFLNWTELSQLSHVAATSFLREKNIDLVLHVFPVWQIARLCKQARIPFRLGTRSRWYHWFSCNLLPHLHRRDSSLHEAQLNIELARRGKVVEGALPAITELPSYYGLRVNKFWPPSLGTLAADSRQKVILHVGSRLSARNWPVESFVELSKNLVNENKLVFLTGTKVEGDQFRKSFQGLGPSVLDLTGQLSLAELFGFIASCDVLVACSTGPLHMAAALGLKTIGIYPPIRPMHAGRWGPIGLAAQAQTKADAEDCRRCKSNPQNCPCMRAVTPQAVKLQINC